MPRRKKTDVEAQAEGIAAAKAASAAVRKKVTGEEFETVSETKISSTPVTEKVAELESPVPVADAIEKPVLVQTQADLGLPANYYPIDMAELPSGGKYYNGQQIYLRNFKVIEIKKLASINGDTAEDVINKILSDVVKGVPYDTILSNDKIAIMFYIRVNTFPDPNYKIKYTCNNPVDTLDVNGAPVLGEDGKATQHACNHEGDLHFTAADLDIKQLKGDFDATKDLSFQISTGEVISWRFATIADEKNMEQDVKNAVVTLKTGGVPEDDIDSDLMEYSYLINTINGVELSLLEKYAFITEGVMPGDYIKLTSAMVERFDFGVDTNIKTVCAECSKDVKVAVLFSEQFFFPSYIA
jgi:hypothetical protein